MGDFEHDESFEAVAEATGHLELNRYETYYQQLFSEALEDGVITGDERDKLERAADQLGLDRERLAALEDALRVSYETHHGSTVSDHGHYAVSDTVQAPAPEQLATIDPPSDGDDEEASGLRARVAVLEDRVRELERQLDEARSQVAYEVDFSDCDAPVPSAALDEPEALHRRLRHDPRDVNSLRALFYAYQGNIDRQWCVAQALTYLGQADDAQCSLYRQHQLDGLIQPSAAIDPVMWRRLLFHPDDEVLTSDILRVIVSAVLLAHSAALKGAGQLPVLAPAQALDPATSTVQAARCFHWAAQTLGMAPPPLCANPEAQDVVAQMVPAVPPVCSLGRLALSGRSANELAFIAGQQLAYFRPERFIRLLVPDLVDLHDLFLAALAIGNPKLPLNAEVRSRVEPVANAISPLLESREVDALRGAYRRFVEHGGIANLQRWGMAADLTAVRAGFLLCGNLQDAERMLTHQGHPWVAEAMEDLIVFLTGERYAKLRQHMSIDIA